MALAITGLLLGALGSLLIYASRTLAQSVSDSTVQQQGVIALRKLSDDLVQSTIYSVYSVSDPGPSNHLAPVANGLNVTFLSPYGVSSQPNSRLFNPGPTHHPRFRTWVGYSVDSSRNLVRYDRDTPPQEVLSPPSAALATPLLLTDFTIVPSVQAIEVQDAAGNPISDGFSISPTPAIDRAVNVVLRIQDFFASTRFQQLNFTTQVYLRNTYE